MLAENIKLKNCRSTDLPAQAGFMLSEGIIASSLIVTTIVGILALLTTSLRHAQFSKEQFIASMLAQEGIEVVRSIRDENLIAKPKRLFDSGLNNGNWQVAYGSHSLVPSSGNPLRFDPPTGLYQYAAGQESDFKRTIIIGRGITDDELIIRSYVEWEVRGIPFSIDVEDHLFNWAKPSPSPTPT